MNLKDIGSGFKNIVNPVLGGLSDAIGIASGFEAQRQARSANAYSQYYNANKYRIMADDLRGAGINPILYTSKGLSPGQGLPMQHIPSAIGTSSAMDVFRGTTERRAQESKSLLDMATEDLQRMSKGKVDRETALYEAQRQHEGIKQHLTELKKKLAKKEVQIVDADIFRKNHFNWMYGKIRTAAEDIIKGLNGDENLYKRWFEKQYKMLFDLMILGIDKLKKDW